MGKRRRARELAVQVLFHIEFSGGEPEEVFDLIYENFGAGESIRPFSRELVVGVCEKIGELDAMIRRASENWRLERMPQVDRNVLRLAVYEIGEESVARAGPPVEPAIIVGREDGGFSFSPFSFIGVFSLLWFISLFRRRRPR